MPRRLNSSNKVLELEPISSTLVDRPLKDTIVVPTPVNREVAGHTSILTSSTPDSSVIKPEQPSCPLAPQETNKGVHISVYAIPLFKGRDGTARFAYIPVREGGDEQSCNAPPSTQSDSSQQDRDIRSSSLIAAVNRQFQNAAAATASAAKSTWDSWGRLDKKTWLRWVHDMGQNMTEDVSPEARLARGISSRANKVTVYHPDCVPHNVVHQQVATIVSSRSRSEMWRLVGFMAFFPVGLVLDHTVLIAVPGPVSTGYSSYKIYTHAKGARGSFRLKQLIQSYDECQRQDAAGSRSCSGANPFDQAPVNSFQSSRSRSSQSFIQSSKTSRRKQSINFGHSKAESLSEALPMFSEDEADDDEAIGAPLEAERRPATTDNESSQADGVQPQSLSDQEQNGLAYVAMPQLSQFVEILLSAPGDVLPEEDARALCELLPREHQGEVHRHLAELRRRHERQSGKAQQTLKDHELSALGSFIRKS